MRVPVFDHQLLERPTEVELNDSCDVQKQPDQLRDADMRPCRQMDTALLPAAERPHAPGKSEKSDSDVPPRHSSMHPNGQTGDRPNRGIRPCASAPYYPAHPRLHAGAFSYLHHLPAPWPSPTPSIPGDSELAPKKRSCSRLPVDLALPLPWRQVAAIILPPVDRSSISPIVPAPLPSL